MLPRLERLPRPQQSALGVAFGLQEGDAPNRFLVGLAVLTLLADAAEEQPLLCLVDDAQWPDQVSLQCLAFAARRSMAEPIALVFAERDTSDESELADLPELSVEGLGDHEARLLLATAVRGRLDAQVQDRIIAETRGSPLALAFSLRRGSDAPPLLLKAAKRLEPLDPELARETYLEALGAAIFASRLNRGIGEVGVAQSALGAPPGPQPPRTVDLLLDGLATQFTEGYAAGVPQLQRALHALRQGAERGEDAMHWLWLACRIAPDLWDDETWNELTVRQVQLARDAGALNVLPIALTYRAGVCVHAGEFGAAAALIDEAAAITRQPAPRHLCTPRWCSPLGVVRSPRHNS